MQRTRRAICSPRGQLTISLSGPAACMCRHSNSARPGSGLDHLSNKEDEMTSTVVETRLPRSNTSRLSNEAERPTAAVNQLSRAKQLAESLLSERGEASGAIPSGYLGLTVGWVEGIELNFIGAGLGIAVRRPALKFPGIGRLGLPIA